MNSHYLVVFLAFLLGQFLMTSVNIYIYQKSKDISWWNAMNVYVRAEVGYFIIGLIAIMSICFILPDFINLNLTREELMSMEKRDWKQTMQLYFKTTSFGLGCFVQYITFRFKDKGRNAIDKAVDGLG